MNTVEDRLLLANLEQRRQALREALVRIENHIKQVTDTQTRIKERIQVLERLQRQAA